MWRARTGMKIEVMEKRARMGRTVCAQVASPQTAPPRQGREECPATQIASSHGLECGVQPPARPLPRCPSRAIPVAQGQHRPVPAQRRDLDVGDWARAGLSGGEAEVQAQSGTGTRPRPRGQPWPGGPPAARLRLGGDNPHTTPRPQ